MFTSSSAAQFTSSSSATPSSAAVDSTLSAPSTGLTARTAMSVPVQEQVRDLKSEKTWSPAAEARFAELPREVLEIIAADAGDTLEEAQAILGAMAQMQQVDDKAARAWTSDPLSQKRMQKENPDIGPLGQLLRAFSPGHVNGLFPTLHEARELLRGQAEAQGYSQAEIDAWLASDNTLIQLIETQDNWQDSWLSEIPSGEGSDAVALHCLAKGCSLAHVPSHLKSYRVCLQAVTRDSSGLGAMELHHMPAAHLTPELVRAAVSKHPEAIGILGPEHRTLALYELAGKRADFDAFRELPVTQQVAADPRYQAVLARLQKQAATA
jgi:hypothetical protein